jgi:coenzyme F420 hydrogenase subunit beta
MNYSVRKLAVKNGQKLPLANIFQRELCTGCGACVAICPQKIIELQYLARKGVYSAKILPGGVESCTGCGLCEKVCPAIRIVGSEKIRTPLKDTHDILRWLIGDYKKIYVGYAVDNALRYECSSGGMATSILLYKLRTNRIKGALIAMPMTQKVIRHEINLAESEKEIIENKGTIYCQINYAKAWEHIKNFAGKMAIVGQPCQLNAFDLFSSAKRMNGKGHFKIGLFCGGTNSHRTLNFLFRRMNIDPDNILRLRYRSGGWPGRKMVAQVESLKNRGRYSNVTLFDRDSSLLQSYLYRFCFSGSFFPDICLACKDQTAEHADISLGDAWIPRYLSSDKVGTNIINCRTRIAQELLERMFDENLICLEDASPEDIISSQGNCLVGKKIGAWADYMNFNDGYESAALKLEKLWPAHVPSKEILRERRLYRWMVKNMPDSVSFFCFVIYNLLTHITKLSYSLLDSRRRKAELNRVIRQFKSD